MACRPRCKAARRDAPRGNRAARRGPGYAPAARRGAPPWHAYGNARHGHDSGHVPRGIRARLDEALSFLGSHRSGASHRVVATCSLGKDEPREKRARGGRKDTGLPGAEIEREREKGREGGREGGREREREQLYQYTAVIVKTQRRPIRWVATSAFMGNWWL